MYALTASQAADKASVPLLGPGLPAGTTVASYLRDVYGYEHGFRWHALLILASYVLGFAGLAVLLMHKSWLQR